jgi:formate hydrogenlyase subunit 4
MDIRALSEIGVRLVLGSLGLAVFGIFFGLVYKGIDRKLSAHMQGRVGPPLRQPFRDVVKLFAKENIVPDQAIPWVFNFIPLVGLIVTTSILVYLPLGGFPPLFATGGDLIVVLYLLMIPSLCLVIGGFSSGSPYAIVGAQREMAVMIAYEFPLAILIVTIAWKLLQKGVTEVFSFSTIVSMPVWNQVSGPLGLIGFAILLVVLLLVTPAELSKIPFDAAEAETEIAGGLLVEYSGRNLAMFYLTDGVKTIVFASLIVAVFFPYGLSNVLGLSSYVGTLVDMVFFLFKVFLVVLFSVTLIRVAIARLKIDQIVYTYWIPLTLASLVGLILVMWDSVIMSFLTNA